MESIFFMAFDQAADCGSGAEGAEIFSAAAKYLHRVGGFHRKLSSSLIDQHAPWDVAS